MAGPHIALYGTDAVMLRAILWGGNAAGTIGALSPISAVDAEPGPAEF